MILIIVSLQKIAKFSKNKTKVYVNVNKYNNNSVNFYQYHKFQKLFFYRNLFNNVNWTVYKLAATNKASLSKTCIMYSTNYKIFSF